MGGLSVGVRFNSDGNLLRLDAPTSYRIPAASLNPGRRPFAFVQGSQLLPMTTTPRYWQASLKVCQRYLRTVPATAVFCYSRVHIYPVDCYIFDKPLRITLHVGISLPASISRRRLAHKVLYVLCEQTAFVIIIYVLVLVCICFTKLSQ